MTIADSQWFGYVRAFHERRTGITEDVLGRAVSSRGLTPYQWITAPVPLGARTLDVACGSGPCLRLRLGEPWTGLDQSSSELARARASGASNVREGDATRLPFSDGSFDAVVCSMALMLLTPLERALDEARRVLVNDGLLVAMVPARQGLTLRDVARYVRLQRHLGQRLSYPNEATLVDDGQLFARHGFSVVENTVTRFEYAMSVTQDAERLVHSLYVPDASPSALTRATRLARGWLGGTIGIPLRRITLVAT